MNNPPCSSPAPTVDAAARVPCAPPRAVSRAVPRAPLRAPPATAARAGRSSRLALAACVGLTALSGCGASVATVRAGDLTVRTLTLNYNNVHVVQRGAHTVVVDAGLQGDAAELDAAMRAEGIDPAKVGAVIVTHGHADHAGGARWFKQRYGTKIIAGSGDQPLLRSGRNDKLCSTGTLASWQEDQHQHATYTPVEADVWVGTSQELAPVAGLAGRVEALPGHTQGSLVVLVGQLAFVGDLFRGGLVGSSAVRHLYMCDLAANGRDLTELLARWPQATTFFTGHFGPVARDEVVALAARLRAEFPKASPKQTLPPKPAVPLPPRAE